MADLTPEQWVTKLDKKLADRQPELAKYEAYYDGRHRLAFATSKFRETFGSLFSAFADNWCDLVVDASAERLEIIGFRLLDEEGDQEAWRIWQANQLDAESNLGHTQAGKCGMAYVLVGPGDDDKTPLITVEDPGQMILATAPGNRRMRVAAWKRWLDDSGLLFGTLYLPDTIYKVQSTKKADDKGHIDKVEWVERDVDAPELKNPIGAVPVVALSNNPTMTGEGRSDIAKVIPMQDAVNKLVSDMIVASEYAAFRQRWATGIEIPPDAETGQPMDTERFLSSVSRMWTVGDENAKFGEFDVTDLNNYVQAIEMLVQHVAAQTRTPPHYLLGQSGAFPSGESLKSTETGLVAKVRRKHLWFGEPWEEAMRMGFTLIGDAERAAAIDAETIWSDPESRSEGEHVDAVLKMKALGLPDEALWEMLPGATPQKIARWKALRVQQQLENPTPSPLFALAADGTPANGNQANGKQPPVPVH